MKPNQLNNKCFDIAFNIKQLMLLHSISEAELARRTGLPQTTVNSLLTKSMDAKTSTLKPIAAIFNLTVSHLIGELPIDFDKLGCSIYTNNRNVWHSIPIIKWEDVPGWCFVQKQVNPSTYNFVVTEKNVSATCFAVVTRPFMVPLFRENSLLIIDPEYNFRDGMYVLLGFNNQEPTIRIINFDGDKILLKHPLMLNYEPIELGEKIEVYGSIIECRTNI